MKTLQIQTNSKGQATTESILLIAISVLILLGLMSQFYQPLDRYLNAYMGPYLTCLLDVGELPALGGGEVSGECNIENFARGADRPAFGAGGAGTSSERNSRNNAAKEAAQNTERSSGSARGEGSEGGGGSSGRSRRPVEVASRGGDAGRGEGKIVQEVPDELAQTRYFKMNSFGGGQSGASRRRFVPAQGIAGVIAQERERLERRQGRIRTITSIGEDKSKSKKMIVKPPQRKVAEASVDEPWSFGRIFRIALIVMMIIAILLFVGGQALQISKGMEK